MRGLTKDFDGVGDERVISNSFSRAQTVLGREKSDLRNCAREKDCIPLSCVIGMIFQQK